MCQCVPYTLTLTCRSQIRVNTPAIHVNLNLTFADLWVHIHAFISFCRIRMTNCLFVVVVVVVVVKDVVTSDESVIVRLYRSEC